MLPPLAYLCLKSLFPLEHKIIDSRGPAHLGQGCSSHSLGMRFDIWQTVKAICKPTSSGFSSQFSTQPWTLCCRLIHPCVGVWTQHGGQTQIWDDRPQTSYPRSFLRGGHIRSCEDDGHREGPGFPSHPAPRILHLVVAEFCTKETHVEFIISATVLIIFNQEFFSSTIDFFPGIDFFPNKFPRFILYVKTLYMFRTKTIKMIFKLAGGLGKMSQSIKILMCKHGDPSSIPRTQVRTRV